MRTGAGSPLRGLLLCAALAANGCVGAPRDGGGTAAPATPSRPGLKIAYTANVSGEIEPCGCRSYPSGGIHRKATLFAREGVVPGGPFIILDAGDLFYASTPTPPFREAQWNAQAETVLESYNRAGTDAATPGEIDFASGIAQFDALRGKAKFPFLAANLRKDGKPYLAPSVILTRQGHRIAVIGLVDETLRYPSELQAISHQEEARRLVPELRRHADYVVALTHLGLEKDKALAEAVPGIDVIVGGHSQSYLQTPIVVGSTQILQTSFRNQHVGIYAEGTNRLIQLDDAYEPKGSEATFEKKLLATAKARIADLNKKADDALFSVVEAANVLPPSTAYQTFVKCAECHDAQYKFYRKTAHAGAYKTLAAKKQNHNKDCLQCHTLGMGEPSGWTRVERLVLDARGNPVDPKAFAAKLPSMNSTDLTRYRKAYINVQCEHCHGPGGDHPFGSNSLKAVATTRCLQCHTEAQAPAWYKDGKPNDAVIQLKKRQISCPAMAEGNE